METYIIDGVEVTNSSDFLSKWVIQELEKKIMKERLDKFNRL